MSAPGEGTPIRAANPNSKFQAAQREVDATRDVMKQNIDKIIERDRKLQDLGPRAEALEDGASTFQRSSYQLRRKYWWQNLKMKLIIGGVVAVIVIIIIVAATTSNKS